MIWFDKTDNWEQAMFTDDQELVFWAKAHHSLGENQKSAPITLSPQPPEISGSRILWLI